MNYANVKYIDIANGRGVRTSLFVSGCTHCCPGCFNEEAQAFEAGAPFDKNIQEKILASLEPSYIAGLTVLGGEPMEPQNQEAVCAFLKKVRARFPQKNIWLYTGDTLEDLCNPSYARRTKFTDDLLACVDVLVDGPFIEDKKDITLQFRGSANQRLIDMNKTREKGKIILLSAE